MYLMGEYLEKKDEEQSLENKLSNSIELSNLTYIYHHPNFKFNRTLDESKITMAKELDTKPNISIVHFGHNIPESVQHLAVNVLYGYFPDQIEKYKILEQLVAKIELDLLNHNGYIGIVKLERWPLQTTTQLLLQSVTKLNNGEDIPMYWFALEFEILKNAVQFYKSIQGRVDKVVIINAQLFTVLELTTLLNFGVNVLFTNVGNAHVTKWMNVIFGNVSKPEMHDCQLISVVAELCKNFPTQIVLSHGVQRKSQLQKYGGGGYTYLMDYFLPELKRYDSSIDIQGLVEGNPKRIMTWDKKVLEKVYPANYRDCHICDGKFEPVEGKYYSKYTFEYCSMECLRLHVKKRFQRC